MRKYTAPIGVGLLAACCLQLTVAQEARDVLNNEDILTLVAGGVSENVIVTKIVFGNTDLDTSAEALVALTEASVPDRVIVHMIQAEPDEELCADHASSD